MYGMYGMNGMNGMYEGNKSNIFQEAVEEPLFLFSSLCLLKPTNSCRIIRFGVLLLRVGETYRRPKVGCRRDRDYIEAFWILSWASTRWVQVQEFRLAQNGAGKRRGLDVDNELSCYYNEVNSPGSIPFLNQNLHGVR